MTITLVNRTGVYSRKLLLQFSSGLSLIASGQKNHAVLVIESFENEMANEMCLPSFVTPEREKGKDVSI